ncbi:MAG: relaxase domain-containing protein, partial [Acidimicrobiales bacterium]
SREADPHRHIHLMLNVRAQAKDGSWHGIHSAALRQHIGATNAIAHQVMMADPGLRAALASEGLSLGPDGEVNEARTAVGALSKRAARWVTCPIELAEVHRFLKLATDPSGMPKTVPDEAYAALSLAMRAGEAPEAVAEALVNRGAVVLHASVAEATAAIAGRVLEAVGRPGALAVTVSTNEAAEQLNAAVRSGRVAAGDVDDARVAIGMDGVRIGAGDLIVTRHNDAGADVSNRQRWAVESIADTGAVMAVDGGHRVALAPSWAAEFVQLGYAVTDYGNQGVTTDASVTWLGPATSAAGLYVGASRGRLANEVHMVAPDMESGQGSDHRRDGARPRRSGPGAGQGPGASRVHSHPDPRIGGAGPKRCGATNKAVPPAP